jgi:hypothetical protein
VSTEEFAAIPKELDVGCEVSELMEIAFKFWAATSDELLGSGNKVCCCE